LSPFRQGKGKGFVAGLARRVLEGLAILAVAFLVTSGAFALIEQFRLELARCLIGAAGINLIPPHATEDIPEANGKS
jgi:hypothetical protein